MRPLVVIGDTLLDRDVEGHAERLCPDAPAPIVEEPVARSRPGGAGLAAALAAGDGRDVTLVTALGRDPAGQELAGLLAAAGVKVLDLGSDGRTAQKTRVRAGGHTLVRIDEGGRGGGAIGALGAPARAALGRARAVLVADYGRGITADPGVRAALAALPRHVPVVWDPHPRGAEPVAGARLATPNRDEAARLVPDVDGTALAAVTARAQALAARWQAGGVAVTLGADGALLVGGDGTPLAVPAPPAGTAPDPCGAGDRFAASAAGMLADGALPSEAVTGAVAAASRFVAGGGASALALPGAGATPPGAEPDDPVAAVRRRGGTVVATGGCFDLLHAGHVRMLAGARALGDCLVVLLNSDDSVRRLKGSGRPLVPAHDRAAVVSGLACVDAVRVFDEDTPERALAELRPDIWVKGADYAVADLPEAAVVRAWGGQAVVLPYVPGHSTTTIIEEVTRREHP
ncbi:MAG TPA: D-glycero-beta-D-manno-heptose 1-phosphate adenylyltransferase [Egibacteraceae bacterium]|nr:D-glycero-beta-D-manno-heptose 1-phosphate adenylyltransferase [Egibacteraceae bacterium]